MGKITVIGIGPGSLLDMTPRAREAISQAQVVAGYNTYIRLVEPLLAAGAPVNDDAITNAMAGNICRCGTYGRIRQAIKRAADERGKA